MGDPFLVFRLLRWFRQAAYRERPVERGGAILYPVCRPARYFFAFGVLLAGGMGLLSLVVDPIAWYVRAAYVPLVALLFTRWPWVLKLDGEGISKRSYLGLRRIVRWPEVSALTYDRPASRFTIVSRTGARIRCSPFMTGPAHFYREMYRRAVALGPMPTRTLDELTESAVSRERWEAPASHRDWPPGPV